MTGTGEEDRIRQEKWCLCALLDEEAGYQPLEVPRAARFRRRPQKRDTMALLLRPGSRHSLSRGLDAWCVNYSGYAVKMSVSARVAFGADPWVAKDGLRGRVVKYQSEIAFKARTLL